jgi:hypothetical protein
MTVNKKGPPCPADIALDALERAINAARKIQEENPDRFKFVPASPKLF